MDYGPAAPHGPDMTGTHNPIHEMDQNERQIFNYLLRPDDIYTDDGVYWADLPLAKQVRFVASNDAKESRREASNVWAMFKADPLSPVAFYFRNMVLPGAGLGLEGYVVRRRRAGPRLNRLQIRPLLHWQPQAVVPGRISRVLEDADHM